MPIGVVVKKGSAQAYEIARELIEVAGREGVELCFEDSGLRDPAARMLGSVCRFNVEKGGVPRRVVVIGGDGTLLRFLSLLKGEAPLLMTIRAGRRGFFFDVEPYEAEERFLDFLRDRYTLIEYERLRIIRGDEELGVALNEAAVLSHEGKVVRLTVNRNDERIYSLDGDGVVVASTAGSTAYALSAGGPIVDPGLKVMVVAPLNPIQLHLRPVVLSIDTDVVIEVRSGSSSPRIIIDGVEHGSLKPGEELRVTRAYMPVRIARFRVEGFYERLFTRVFQYW